MSDKKFTIGIDTTADTTGAKETERALDQVSDEARRTERELGALEKGARRVDQELAKTGNTSEGVSQKMGGRFKGSIQSAGFQIQDFAVQVGGGTSAMTAFGQQAPQFLGAFGPAGAIAGAFISIGAVAYNVFTKMGVDAGTAKEKLEFLNEVVDKIAKNKTDDLNQEFADTAAALDLATRRAAALKTGLEEVVKSENKLALAQLARKQQDREFETAEANAKAVLDGKPPDTKRVENDASLAISERAAELARQGALAERGRIQAAQDEAQIASQKLAAGEAARQKAADLLALDRERLGVIRQQTDELQKQAKKRDPTDDPGRQLLGAIFPKTLPLTPAAKEAQKKLDDPAFKAETDILEGRIASLEKKLTGDDAELNKNVADLDVEYLAVRTKVANLVAAAKNNTASINLDLGTADRGREKQDVKKDEFHRGGAVGRTGGRHR